MQFKIDENLPAEIAELLLENGYDTKTVLQQELIGAKDEVLINICKQENRIFVTLDTDFADINTYVPEECKGIIILRVGNQSKVHIMKVFKNVLSRLDIEPIIHHLRIVEETVIRIRGK
jgi:predicted nuclease of predicted toxin-antitoxin system